MKEKKQTNRLSYSKFGKLFRGFLCMLTFGVFCASLILTIYAVSWYGDRIIYEPADHYTDTDLYQMEVTDEINHILYNTSLIDESEVSEDKLSILYMPEEAVCYYDIKSMYNDDFSPNDMKDLSEYEKQEPLALKNITDYEQMKEYLLADDVPFEYIYFDEKSFIKLFEKDGLKNTDYRFSKDYSQDAYFIFENYEITQKQAVSKTEDTTESAEENTVAKPDKVSSEDTTEITTEDIEKEENTEMISEIAEDTESEEVIMTPYSLTSYAVYEPYKTLFYTTWDDYFSDIPSYLYRAEDLSMLVKEAEEEGVHYNSIIMPLLKSHNIQFLGEVIHEASIPYSNINEAKENLAFQVVEGVYFCIKTGDSVKHSNGKNGQDIEKMKRFYRFEKRKDGTIKQTHSANLKDMDSLDVISDTLMSYPSNATLWVGIQSGNDNIQGIAQRVEGYYWFASNTWILVIVAVVSFVLLMIQAGWLIYTTGRRYKGDKEVSLAFFDRWYTDIWALVTVMILIGCMIVGFLTLEAVGYASTKEMMAFLTVIGMLPFGFCFMVLTLSFVRRIKARNIWNHFLIVRFVKYVDGKIKNGQQDSGQEENRKSSVIVEKLSHIWGRCKEAYYNIKGTRKLLSIFVIYLLTEIAIMVAMMKDRGQWMLAFCALQIVALWLVVRVVKDIDKLTDGVKEITQGNLDSKVEINEKLSVFDDLANGINHIGDGLKNAVETSLKDERMKTELITNVSHDLKTPLTSIINYVNLLKKQEMPNEDAKHYVEVLDGKAQRLKQLTEDLVEAAKATSGNIELEMMPLTFDELMKQALGEFEDKFEKRNLTIIARYPEQPAVVMADGRRLFRVIENVLQNIYKYAMEGTRVYADLERDGDKIVFTLKNVSAAPLNISPDELMERFTRGDSSRTTEGSGLGLSIAKDLTRLQNGEFEIQLDGDLFKVIIRFPEHK